MRARAYVRVRARTRTARMFTEYVDPLSSPRHTYVLARRSSFTPICLRSPGTIQPQGADLDLLHHLDVRTFRIYRDVFTADTNC